MYRSIADPIRPDPSFVDRWETINCGLLTSWERGREKSVDEPKLAEQALAGQLMVLPWKGGVEKAIQKKSNTACLTTWRCGKDCAVKI